MHRWKFPLLLGLLLAVAAIGGSSPGGTAHAATTRVWTGLVSLNWNTAANWDPVGVPAAGDSVVIGAVALDKTLNNNLPADTTLASLTINTRMKIVGNRLGISAVIQTSSVGITLDLPIVLRGDVDAALAPVGRLVMRPASSPPGTVALDMAGHTLTMTSGNGLEFNGDLAGSGTLADKVGSVLFVYPVTFGGQITASAGTSILFSSSFPVQNVCGSAANAAVVLSGAFMQTNCPTSVGSVSGAEVIEMGPGGSLSIAITGETFDGKIIGAKPSAIFCCALAEQTLRGASTFTGNVFVTSGSLYLDGATFPAASQFSAQGKGAFPATLGGYGTFGETILTLGTLDLAPVNDKFGLARFPTLQFAPNVEVYYEIAGQAPGTGFTQIVMTGQLVLDSALLNLNFTGYSPSVGQSITLVKGATALLDTFHNFGDGKDLPEGATFTASGMQFKITYLAGAGHDVVVTRVAGTGTPTKFKRFVPFVARDS